MPTNAPFDTDVLIVGAGPVGLTLALDLGKRGVKCILIEKNEAPSGLPKMERCNARTMEIYRRLGLSEKIRAAGFPADVPMDVFLVFSLAEPPLLRLPYPSVAEMRSEIAMSNDGSMPLEPYQLISQYTLEPLLKSVVEKLPSVSVRFGNELTLFEQDEEGVTGKVRISHGDESSLRARYLVGCDGGSSQVRKQLGIRLEGDSNLQQLRQALFRSDDLFDRIEIGRGRHYHMVDDRSTFLIVQDDTKHFTLHSVVDEDADMEAMFRKIVGIPVEFETLYVGKWTQHLLVAERYMNGRVFLAGDAVHLMIPTGGLGMNSGVGDAIDLSWKLAATLQGWGGPELLKSYESERRPIGLRNVSASKFATLGRRKWRAAYKSNIREDSPEGKATREELVRIANVEQRKSTEMIGAELGYFYKDSPIVIGESDDPPADDFLNYVPSTWPGSRLPHVWLEDGVSVLDRVGSDWTLLNFGKEETVAGLVAAAARIGVPLKIVNLDSETARRVYERNLLLLRPDLHVAWRGDSAPENPEGLLRVVVGHDAKRSAGH